MATAHGISSPGSHTKKKPLRPGSHRGKTISGGGGGGINIRFHWIMLGDIRLCGISSRRTRQDGIWSIGLSPHRQLRGSVFIRMTLPVACTAPSRAHLHLMGMLRFMTFDINQASLPIPFFFIFFFKFCSWRLFLSLRPFKLYFIP